MKRNAPNSRVGCLTTDIEKDFSSEQLKGIGLVAIAWNEVAFMIDVLLYSGLRLSPNFWLDIVGQTQDNQKHIFVKRAAQDLQLPPVFCKSIDTTLDDIANLRPYRNAVVHARVFNAPSGIGELIKSGKVIEILLTEEALNGLYERLKIMRLELLAILALFDMLRSSAIPTDGKVRFNPNKIQHEPEIQRWLKELCSYQKERASLPPLPSFPT